MPDFNMEAKDAILLKSLRAFFEDPTHLKSLTNALSDDTLSLRVIDWACTNYSKKHNVTYLVTDQFGQRAFNLFLEYKSQLKSFSKRYFDPIKRRDSIEFVDSNGRTIHTTCGQLCFFRWAIKYNVVDFCLEHLEEIEKDMMDSTRAAAASKHAIYNGGGPDSSTKPRRRQLSKAAVQSCTTTKLRVRINFK